MRLSSRTALLTAAVAVASCGALSAQLVPIGAEFAVNTTTAGSQFAAAVAGEPGGPFLVVWQSSDQDGSGAGIYARLFDAAGAALSGEIHVSQTTAGDQVTPAVAWSPAGSFLVVWASNGQDGSGYGIFARRLLATTGQPLGGEFQVHVTTAGGQLAPRVAAQGTGFYVAWSGLGASGDTNDIYGRGFAALGTGAGATTGEIRLNAGVSGNQVQPAIAAAGSGLVVAWASDGADASGFGVVARRFDGVLAALSPDLAVPENTIYDQSAPAVTGFAGGGFAVAWQRALQEIGSTIGPQPVIALRRFAGSAGYPASGPELQVQADTTRRHEQPAMVADGEEAVTVAWQELDLASGDKQIALSRYDSANAPLLVEFPLSTTSTGDQIAPALAGSSRLVAAWASFGQDGSSFGVFARRFGVALPPCAADAGDALPQRQPLPRPRHLRHRRRRERLRPGRRADDGFRLLLVLRRCQRRDRGQGDRRLRTRRLRQLLALRHRPHQRRGHPRRRRHLDRRRTGVPQSPQPIFPADPRHRSLPRLRCDGAVRHASDSRVSEGWLDDDEGTCCGATTECRTAAVAPPLRVPCPRRQDPERRRARRRNGRPLPAKAAASPTPPPSASTRAASK